MLVRQRVPCLDFEGIDVQQIQTGKTYFGKKCHQNETTASSLSKMADLPNPTQCLKWDGMRWYAIPALPWTGINHTGTSVPRNTIPVRLNELNSL